MSDDRGQSEILGEVLLVGVVVLVLSVAGAFVLGDVAEPRDEAYADVEATVEGGSLALVHRGGETLPTSDLRVRVAVNDTPATGVTWTNGTVEGDGDALFELGERWTHPLSGVGNGSDARVAVTLAAVGGDGTGTVVYRDDAVEGGGGTTPRAGTPSGSPPTADAGGNRSVTGEAGESVTLDGRGTTDPDGDAVTYAWTVTDADGIAGSVALRDAGTATPTLAVTGNVTDRDHDVRVRLRARDGDGATTDETVVTVRRSARPPTADAGGNRSVRGEDGANVTLDGTGSSDPDGEALTYRWRITDRDGLPTGAVALANATEPRPEFRVTDAVEDRNHTVTVELTVDDGSGTDTDRTAVTVAERVETRIEATQTSGPAPLSVSFVGVAEGAPNEGVVDFGERSVQPYDPGGQDGEDGDPTSATVTDGGRTLRLSGNAWKYVDFAYDISDRTVLRFDFRSTAEGEIHAIGFENDERQSSARFYALYGTQRYGRDDLGYAGDGAFESHEVRVDPGYPDQTAQYLVFVADEDAGSAPDAVSEFRDVIVYDEDAYTYEWDWTGDGTYDATGKQPDHAYTAPGTHEVRLRATAPDGRTAVVTRTVRVGDPPTAVATASTTDVRAGDRVTFDGSGSTDPAGGGLTYEWDVDGDGTYDEAGVTAATTYDRPGSYDVRLRVTDAGGRTATDTVTVRVGEVVDAVNFGGKELTDDGVTYRADRGNSNADVSGGSTSRTNDPIENTTADERYQIERYGDFQYRRGVPDGTYRVRLEFAEIYWGDGRVREGPTPRGDRVFDVLVEGNRRVDDLDVYARLEDAGRNGHDTALVLTYTVEVTDGRLDVDFQTEADNAKASAVVVERVG